MKWTRAVHHLAELAEKCGELPASFFWFQVVKLWGFGDLLDMPRHLDVIEVALVTDLPVDEVPWLSEPAGAEHWANSTRLSRNPISEVWWPRDAPAWNHRIERPALVWSAADGIDEEALVAVSDGTGELVRIAAPTPEELAKRVEDELAGVVHRGSPRRSSARPVREAPARSWSPRCQFHPTWPRDAASAISASISAWNTPVLVQALNRE